MACEPVASNWPTVHSQDDKKSEYIYIYHGGMILTGGYKIIEKTSTSTIGAPQLPHGMAWN